MGRRTPARGNMTIGMAAWLFSDYTDITDGTYLNQCSVYNGGIAGVDNDKFVVAYGYSDFLQ